MENPNFSRSRGIFGKSSFSVLHSVTYPHVKFQLFKFSTQYCLSLQGVQNNILRQISIKYQLGLLKQASFMATKNQTFVVKKGIASCSDSYKAKLEKHPNHLTRQLRIPGSIRGLKKARDIFNQEIHICHIQTDYLNKRMGSPYLETIAFHSYYHSFYN